MGHPLPGYWRNPVVWVVNPSSLIHSTVWVVNPQSLTHRLCVSLNARLERNKEEEEETASRLADTAASAFSHAYMVTSLIRNSPHP